MSSASAPGKLMLFGEYAVLEGGPAVVCAVDRRATVCIEPLDDGQRVELLAPQLDHRPVSFDWAKGTLHPACGPQLEPSRVALARRLIESLELRAVRVRADTGAHFFGHRKMGLGSSAALTVAWVAAADRCDDPETVRPRAHAIHRGFQQGRGSGADIAASCAGGIVLYRNGPTSSVTALQWPQGLHWLPVWTRRSADTRSFLDGLGAWSRREPAAYARHLDGLAGLAGRAAGAFGSGAGSDLVGLVEDYGGALSELGKAADLEIVSPIHARLADLARACGVAYKPSGAGGGDFGFALSDDPGRLHRFGAGLPKLDAQSAQLRIDPQGVRLEADTQPQGL